MNQVSHLGGSAKFSYAAAISVGASCISLPDFAILLLHRPTSTLMDMKTLASLLFWFSIISLALFFPLRSITKMFTRYVKTVSGVLVFVSYLGIHIFLYGLILRGNTCLSVQGSTDNLSGLCYIFLHSRIPGVGSHQHSKILHFILASTSRFPRLQSRIVSLQHWHSIRNRCLGGHERDESHRNIEGMLLGRRSRAYVVLPALGVIGGAELLSLDSFFDFSAVPQQAQWFQILSVHIILHILGFHSLRQLH